jgi:hypothetical protein
MLYLLTMGGHRILNWEMRRLIGVPSQCHMSWWLIQLLLSVASTYTGFSFYFYSGHFYFYYLTSTSTTSVYTRRKINQSKPYKKTPIAAATRPGRVAKRGNDCIAECWRASPSEGLWQGPWQVYDTVHSWASLVHGMVHFFQQFHAFQSVHGEVHQEV